MKSLVYVPEKRKLGKAFRKNDQIIIWKIEEMEEAAVSNLQEAIESDRNTYSAEIEVLKEHVTFKTEEKSVKGLIQCNSRDFQ